MDVPDQASPARKYLRELPANFREVLIHLREARRTAVYLWPFMWRTTADRERESAEGAMFDAGRFSAEYARTQQ